MLDLCSITDLVKLSISIEYFLYLFFLCGNCENFYILCLTAASPLLSPLGEDVILRGNDPRPAGRESVWKCFRGRQKKETQRGD